MVNDDLVRISREGDLFAFVQGTSIMNIRFLIHYEVTIKVIENNRSTLQWLLFLNLCRRACPSDHSSSSISSPQKINALFKPPAAQQHLICLSAPQALGVRWVGDEILPLLQHRLQQSKKKIPTSRGHGSNFDT